MNNLEINNDLFESIKHIDEKGMEYWEARELKDILDYTEWRKFENVIEKAKISCKNSELDISNHFVEVDKMVNIGSGAKRIQKDYKLSRYACYLIAQNGDSRKKVISLAQTYFAVQTRRQELIEKNYSLMSEDEKRLYQRELIRKGNNFLNQAAKKAGVKNYDKFHNAGYKGLYGGETADDIARRKHLRYREDILDNMCSEELVDNLFRIVQTNSKLKREKIKRECNANQAHYDVGVEVRNTIKGLNGTMPENLDTPKKSIKEIIKINNKKIKKNK